MIQTLMGIIITIFQYGVVIAATIIALVGLIGFSYLFLGLIYHLHITLSK